jgi:hypothetical protein
MRLPQRFLRARSETLDPQWTRRRYSLLRCWARRGGHRSAEEERDRTFCAVGRGKGAPSAVKALPWLLRWWPRQGEARSAVKARVYGFYAGGQGGGRCRSHVLVLQFRRRLAPEVGFPKGIWSATDPSPAMVEKLCDQETKVEDHRSLCCQALPGLSKIHLHRPRLEAAMASLHPLTELLMV